MSETIDSDEYLLTVVRYSHRNPEKGEIAKTEEYCWSSYRDYLSPGSFTDYGIVLEMVDSSSEFEV